MNIITLSRRTLLTAILVLGTAQMPAHAQQAPRVKLATSAGDIVLELAPAQAPKTTENFLQYVKDKHYDGTVFHRVIDGFMIQGGGFTPKLEQKPTRSPIALEAANGLKNERGTIAMARTSNPDSATAQFFINVKDNSNLNATRPQGDGYAVFGKVVAGMDVVDKIRAVRTGMMGGMSDVPTEPVIIRSATLVR